MWQLSCTKTWTQRIEGNKITVGIEIGNTKMFNVYKPPSEDWTTSEDDNGENLSNWAKLNYLHLLYDAKQEGTFKSGRWGSTTSPDLCFSQQIINVRKADWDKYTTYVEENINRIKPISNNYERFTKLIKTAMGKAIPRGHRQDYIPCWSKECDKLLSEYEQTKSEVTSDRLTKLFDEERRQRWVKAMEEMDFSHSSRKSWDLLRKLERTLSKEQAGFRRGRNSCVEVLVLTTHVENGFQKKLKSRAVFLDLLASYHTVWKRGLLLKLAKIIKCKITLRLLEQTLSNRNFKVYLNSEEEATTDVDPQVEWKRTWLEFDIRNSSLIKDPTAKTPSFNLPCAFWTTLNRIRT
ncbi:hypothetical protein QTP88_006714 [Uroleucon formosanum]